MAGPPTDRPVAGGPRLARPGGATGDRRPGRVRPSWSRRRLTGPDGVAGRGTRGRRPLDESVPGGGELLLDQGYVLIPPGRYGAVVDGVADDEPGNPVLRFFQGVLGLD